MSWKGSEFLSSALSAAVALQLFVCSVINVRIFTFHLLRIGAVVKGFMGCHYTLC